MPPEPWNALLLKESGYILHGELFTSDVVEAKEAESWLTAKLGRKKLDIAWDHSDNQIHKFTISGIEREQPERGTVPFVGWDFIRGKPERFCSNKYPPCRRIQYYRYICSATGENQKIAIVFSDPVDAAQEMDGLIHFTPATEATININSNIISLFPCKQTCRVKSV